jgi:nucleotide-binding universal stress UspA family protein
VDTQRVVLVAVDGSPQSRAAVTWAAGEAAALHGRLLVVSVVDTAFLGLWTANRTVRNELRALAAPLVTAATEQAAAQQPGLSVQGRVLLGPVARTLLLLSRHTDVVVVGRSGRGALGRTWFGSVTQRLLVYGHGTTAVIPSTGTPSAEMFADNAAAVVLGIADTPTHPALLRFAFEAAARHDAPLRAVHAGREPVASVADERSALVRYLGRWPAVFPDVLCSAVTRTGDAAAALLDVCRPGDLLVVGQHQRACLEPPRLGSVLSELLSVAPCAVAVVHTALGGQPDLQPGNDRDHGRSRETRQQVAWLDGVGAQ